MLAPFHRRPLAMGLLVVAGLGFVILAALAGLAEDVLLRVDRPVMEWVSDRRTAVTDEVFLWVSRLGSRWVVVPLLVVLMLWLGAAGRWSRVAAVPVLAVGVAVLLEVLLKSVLIQRARPDSAALVEAANTSFPSGHVLTTVVFYGLLPLVVLSATERTWARLPAVLAPLVLVPAMAYSRMHLGVHWLSDTIGSVLLGVVVMVGCHEALGAPARRPPPDTEGGARRRPVPPRPPVRPDSRPGSTR